MLQIKNIIATLLLIVSTVAFSQNQRFDEANKLYSAGKFQDAIAQYESVRATGFVSAELYFNLGNSYYKTGKTAASILNYERSLLLHPGSKDARYNLELAQQGIIDKITPVEEFFLKQWMRGFRQSLVSDSWAKISVITFILFLALMLLFMFGKISLLRKISFYAGISLFLISMVSFSMSKSGYKEATQHNFAIIFSETVTVKGSPSVNSTDLFILHEGTKVKLREKSGEWREIMIQDGTVGWVKASDIEVI